MDIITSCSSLTGGVSEENVTVINRKDGSEMFLRNIEFFNELSGLIFQQDNTLHNHSCEKLKSH
jgi:hypothetical protein